MSVSWTAPRIRANSGNTRPELARQKKFRTKCKVAAKRDQQKIRSVVMTEVRGIRFFSQHGCLVCGRHVLGRKLYSGCVQGFCTESFHIEAGCSKQCELVQESTEALEVRLRSFTQTAGHVPVFYFFFYIRNDQKCSGHLSKIPISKIERCVV
jgi:hypothetical protein